MASLRYVFASYLCCVECGLVGSVMMLDSHPDSNSARPHFNLYGVLNDELILRLKAEPINNLQTMCTFCNSAKQNNYLDPYTPK